MEYVTTLSTVVTSSLSLSNCCCADQRTAQRLQGESKHLTGRVEKDYMFQKSFFLDQEWIVMANRWKESNPKHSVWPISDSLLLAFRFGKARVSLMPTECSWAADLVSGLQAAVLPLSGLNGQHSPAVNIDLRETYAKSNITENPNKTTISKSREPIFAFQPCDKTWFHIGQTRQLSKGS